MNGDALFYPLEILIYIIKPDFTFQKASRV